MEGRTSNLASAFIGFQYYRIKRIMLFNLEVKYVCTKKRDVDLMLNAYVELCKELQTTGNVIY
jgi:hypothetical protein